jgi:2-phosphoglycerate kinase
MKKAVTTTDKNPHFYADILARSLLRVGIPKYEAYDIAHNIWKKFSRQKKDQKKISNYVEEVLKKKGASYVKRYRKWEEILKQPESIIILIGGGTGIGTSTLAMRLAWLLEFNRIISTDSVREIIRKFIGPDISPLLHVSSYQTKPLIKEVKSDHDKLIYGFLSQSKEVLSGVDAIIARAITEKGSTIIEGVHIIPGEMDFLKKYEGKAIIIQVMLDVNQESKHRLHFFARHLDNAKRDKTKYLKYFKEIRLIRDYLVSQAKKNHVPVIENYDLRKVEKQILDQIFSSYGHKK